MENQPDPVEAARLVNDELRVELHAAVDGVMRNRGTQLPDRDLKAQLQSALDDVVDTKLGSAKRETSHGSQTVRDQMRVVPETIDAAVSRLDGKVEAALESGKAGSKRGAALILGLSARLAPLVVPLLIEFAHDEKKLKQVEQSLERILARRMKPSTAKSMASATVKGAQALIRRYGGKGKHST